MPIRCQGDRVLDGRVGGPMMRGTGRIQPVATMVLYLVIALGSALGGVARFVLSDVVGRHLGWAFPWGTLFVNVAGSFAIGFFATMSAPGGRFALGGTSRHFFMTGVLGGFTTFSTFSLQTLALARNGDWFFAGANVFGGVTACLLAAWLGHVSAMLVAHPR